MNNMDPSTKFTPDDFLVEAAPGVARHDVEAVRQPKAKKVRER